MFVIFTVQKNVAALPCDLCNLGVTMTTFAVKVVIMPY